MRLNEIEFLARHGVLRDVRTELDRDFRVLYWQSCYTSLLCSSGPARTVPFRPGRLSDRVQIPDEPGSAEFVQDEPAKRLELVFRERGLRDQQHAVKPCVDQRQNHFPGQHGPNHCVFMSKSSPFLQPFCMGVSHRGVRLRASDAPHARPRGKRPRRFMATCVPSICFVLLQCCVLRWCRFRLVSVSAQPACVMHDRHHKGHERHHSRFVQGFCYSPALHSALVWRRCRRRAERGLHRRSFTQDQRGRRNDAYTDPLTGITRRAALHHAR